MPILTTFAYDGEDDLSTAYIEFSTLYAEQGDPAPLVKTLYPSTQNAAVHFDDQRIAWSGFVREQYREGLTLLAVDNGHVHFLFFERELSRDENNELEPRSTESLIENRNCNTPLTALTIDRKRRVMTNIWRLSGPELAADVADIMHELGMAESGNAVVLPGTAACELVYFDRDATVQSADIRRSLNLKDPKIVKPEPTRQDRFDKARKTIQKEDKARKKVGSDNEKELERIRAELQTIADANLSPLAQGTALDKLAKTTGKTKTELKAELKELKRNSAPPLEKGISLDKASGLRTLRYTGEKPDFREAVHACVAALVAQKHASGAPKYCQIGGKPVRLANCPDGRTEFAELDHEAFWSELNNHITFMRSTDKGDGVCEKAPEDVAKHIRKQAYRLLPPAPEIVHTPKFLADGTLLATEGYHKASNTLMALNGLDVPSVSHDPTLAQAMESLDWILKELLVDFPFCDRDENDNESPDASRANALAMLFTPFLREMFDGLSPLFFVSKPQPGTGGSLLGQLPMWLFDGAQADNGTLAYTKDDAEMQKLLVAAFMEARSHLFFDDVVEFNSRTIIRFLTAKILSGRVLGLSELFRCLNKFSWIGTGNNTAIDSEMFRRTVFVYLNAKRAKVADREFRHPDVSGLEFADFVTQNRGLAVHHILTVIQYWVAQGRKPSKDRLGSYENWAKNVGGVLQAVGVTGFLGNRSRAGATDESESDQAFVESLHKTYGLDNSVSHKEMFELASAKDLEILVGRDDPEKQRSLRKHVSRKLDGRTFEIGDEEILFRRSKDGGFVFEKSDAPKKPKPPELSVLRGRARISGKHFAHLVVVNGAGSR